MGICNSVYPFTLYEKDINKRNFKIYTRVSDWIIYLLGRSLYSISVALWLARWNFINCTSRKIMKKILIMGLPDSGKTTLARELAKLLNAVHFNADEIRSEINKDLGFSHEDRIEQARRMGVLCDIVVRSGGYAIADFVCPTDETRRAFDKDIFTIGSSCFVIWVDRIKESKYEDTNKMFQISKNPFVNVTVTSEGTALHWAHKIAKMLQPTFDPKKPTAFFLGRWQPFTIAHKALVEEGFKRAEQVCIAIRDTQGTDEPQVEEKSDCCNAPVQFLYNDRFSGYGCEKCLRYCERKKLSKNPFSFEEVEQSIKAGMREHEGKYVIMRVPNISHVLYGRDVGYTVEQVDLPDYADVSATKIREQIV